MEELSMLVFCAYWEGKVRENPIKFDLYVKEVHLPLVAKYPNLRKLVYLKGVSKGEVTPKYYQSFELYFDSWEEFEVAKQSSERAEAVVDAKKLEAMFVGSIYHAVYEVQDLSMNTTLFVI